ncbi:unnamed protein product, partial [Prorocentrum cordatum]
RPAPRGHARAGGQRARGPQQGLAAGLRPGPRRHRPREGAQPRARDAAERDHHRHRRQPRGSGGRLGRGPRQGDGVAAPGRRQRLLQRGPGGAAGGAGGGEPPVGGVGAARGGRLPRVGGAPLGPHIPALPGPGEARVLRRRLSREDRHAQGGLQGHGLEPGLPGRRGRRLRRRGVAQVPRRGRSRQNPPAGAHALRRPEAVQEQTCPSRFRERGCQPACDGAAAAPAHRAPRLAAGPGQARHREGRVQRLCSGLPGVPHQRRQEHLEGAVPERGAPRLRRPGAGGGGERRGPGGRGRQRPGEGVGRHRHPPLSLPHVRGVPER